MSGNEDPVQADADTSRDLYDIATWENRTALDSVATRVYGVAVLLLRLIVMLVALLILASQAVLIGFGVTESPWLGLFVLISVLPALALVIYIWYLDPTTREKIGLMVATFLLGVLFAGFAAITNSLLEPFFTAIPVVGFALFFYLVVAPGEETVKLLAVRLWPYTSDRFDAVIDGAIYGAIAGLGFATIENSLYITRQYFAAVEAGGGVLEQTVATTASRSLAGPGHVIYSAFAGYYLGLAKFNRENAGPIIVKGLLVAAFIHGTYNTAVTYLPAVVDLTFVGFLGFVILYDGVFAYLLYRKLERYRAAYYSR